MENSESTHAETHIDELQLDIDELKKLLASATRSRVIDMINANIKTVENLHTQQANAESLKAERSEEGGHVLMNKITAPPQKYFKDITNYAWDQSDKFMKIYVSLSGLESLKKDDVKVEFTDKSFRLRVENLSGKNYQCHVAFLWAKIVPGESYHKVKSDSILLMLRKVEQKTWAFVTEQEGKEDKRKKENKSSKKNDSADPSDNLMGLLKQMYDDGDDEMKKTIAKSWTESRNKPGGDMGF